MTGSSKPDLYAMSYLKYLGLSKEMAGPNTYRCFGSVDTDCILDSKANDQIFEFMWQSFQKCGRTVYFDREQAVELAKKFDRDPLKTRLIARCMLDEILHDMVSNKLSRKVGCVWGEVSATNKIDEMKDQFEAEAIDAPLSCDARSGYIEYTIRSI